MYSFNHFIPKNSVLIFTCRSQPQYSNPGTPEPDFNQILDIPVKLAMGLIKANYSALGKSCNGFGWPHCC